MKIYTNCIIKQPCLLAIFAIILSNSGLSAQKQEWEIDRFERREQEKNQSLDSTLVHLKNRWEIALAYGRWYFINDAISNDEELFSLSGPMSWWQFTGSWHFSERLCLGLSIGIQLKREVPTPDVFSVLAGNNIELEGFGVLFLPIDIGLKYYITKKRFRPFLGLGAGSVLANSRYTIAEGNINTGINRTDYQIGDSVKLGYISAGLDYRLGKRTIFTLNSAYYLSNRFEETIGGYLSYQGLAVNAGLSIVL